MIREMIICSFILCMSFQAFTQSGNKGVNVIEDPRIEHYLNEYNRIVAEESTPRYVYRIQLIATYTRSEARDTQSRFRSLFPEQPVLLTHDGVKFLVRGGEFTKRADAEVKLRDIRREFPSAFLLPRQRIK